MKRLSMLLVAAALMAGGSALASAQPLDRDGSRDRDRSHERDDRRFRDRDDRRFGDHDGRRYFVGETRFSNGYNWRWDGHRWCR